MEPVGRGTKTRQDERLFKANDDNKHMRGGGEGIRNQRDHKGPRFEMLKLLMLSSKSSVARAWQDLSSIDFWGTFGEVVIRVVVAALFDFGCNAGSSMSTTLTTALPSSTFLTLSVSTPFRGDCPEKASQKADPSLANKVCEASEANIASWEVALGVDSGVRASVEYLGVLLGTTDKFDDLVVTAAK